MKAQECPECGALSVKAFVQYGSYFIRCTSCTYEGPTTSWLAVASSMKQPLEAIVVTDSYEIIESLAFGTGNEIYTAVSNVAHQGKLVLLTSPGA